jgi:hypothetical protein
MIDQRTLQQVSNAADRTGFLIARAKNYSTKARLQDRAGTHETGLERCIERGFG